ncbi:hypothetical protein H6G33_09410 [Calothrix sp. FACHB-1219]|uniref:hypothetical protein n=1 Tax=unclassified Calothrix TaxID=2619626 RepID=UPI001685D31B|nr:MULTISPECIES: hypothetical protein [unclassified Calothrix]MBD2201563.1 hypothetical protein [Calothrix sp. FACHB-168]MBD2217249.1 hypothetical protein [Calothrix sp. FACHB-1219]
MSLEEYLALDEFWQEAVYSSVSNFVDEQNKEQKKTFDEMSKKIEDLAPANHMASINRPTFHLP